MKLKQQGIDGDDKQGARKRAPLKDSTQNIENPCHGPTSYTTKSLIALIQTIKQIQNSSRNLDCGQYGAQPFMRDTRKCLRKVEEEKDWETPNNSSSIQAKVTREWQSRLSSACNQAPLP